MGVIGRFLPRMGIVGRFLPRLGIGEMAGLFRGRVAALRGMRGRSGSSGGLRARLDPAGVDCCAAADGLRMRAAGFVLAGLAFSVPLAAGGSSVLSVLPMIPAVLGAMLDAWRADMFDRGRWRPFSRYLSGFMLPGGGWGREGEAGESDSGGPGCPASGSELSVTAEAPVTGGVPQTSAGVRASEGVSGGSENSDSEVGGGAGVSAETSDPEENCGSDVAPGSGVWAVAGAADGSGNSDSEDVGAVGPGRGFVDDSGPGAAGGIGMKEVRE
ncbi:MAG: hypothetical protein LBQ79_06425 [Deltaproteobacteria bacterium]|jgi:hypothetical protein|nr:hypothetical protein [Deltaproteobacteria bacterium]